LHSEKRASMLNDVGEYYNVRVVGVC
jgi:hypothetical protein